MRTGRAFALPVRFCVGKRSTREPFAYSSRRSLRVRFSGGVMARKVFYRRCRLVKRTETGQLCLVSWIPEPYASTGRVIKLRDSDGHWDDGWVVRSAGSNRLPADE